MEISREQRVKALMSQDGVTGVTRAFTERAIDRADAQLRGESCGVCEAGYQSLCPKHGK